MTKRRPAVAKPPPMLTDPAHRARAIEQAGAERTAEVEKEDE